MAAAAAETGLSIDLLSMPSWSNLKEPECGVRLESAVKVLSIVNSGLLGVLGGVSKTEVLPSLSTVILKRIFLEIRSIIDHVLQHICLFELKLQNIFELLNITTVNVESIYFT